VNTPPPSAAAGEHPQTPNGSWPPCHLSDGALERDRHVQVALVHATLAIVAVLADEDDHGRR
jgi:hypothetical protein